MKISVIVPVYNVELYLIKCLDSIINQTYENLEIILVNDGSTDNSGKICDQYKGIDKRILVIHKENGGLSSARNTGINVATGEFIGFIDSDDWIEPDYYELLYNGISKYKSDISVVHLRKVTNNDEKSFKKKSSDSWIELNRTEAMESLFANNLIGYSAVNKLYKKYLFDNIRYPEGLLMEDKATTYKLINLSNKIVVNTSQKYNYLIRNNSIIQSSFNNRNFDSFLIHEEMIQFTDINYPQFSNLIRARYVYESIRMLLMMMRSNYHVKEDYEKCLEIIHENFRYLFLENRIRFTIRILGFLIYILPSIPFNLSKSKCVSNILKKANIA